MYSRLAPALGAEPVIITGRVPGDATLVFLAPMLRRRYGPVPIVEFADLGVSDYCGPVIDCGFEAMIARDPDLQRSVLGVFGGFPLCRLQKVRDDSVIRTEMFKTRNWTPSPLCAHAVPLYAPFTQWRKDVISSKFRRDLQRNRRSLSARSDFRFQEVTDPDAIKDAFFALRSMHEDRWEDGQFCRPDFFEFYLDIAVRGQPVGLTRTYLTTCEGRAIAVDFCVVHQGRVALLLGGFDSEGFGQHSVGTLSMESAIEDSISRGDQVFDFTIGDEPYKKKFGTEPTAMWHLWLGHPAVASLAGLAFALRTKLKST